MSQDQFHWLVVRSSDDLIKQSRELYQKGVAVKGGGQTEKTGSQYIPGPDSPLGGVIASAHHVPSVSGGSMHFDISTASFKNGDDAMKWATEKDGIEFLQNRKDAILIAFRKPE